MLVRRTLLPRNQSTLNVVRSVQIPLTVSLYFELVISSLELVILSLELVIEQLAPCKRKVPPELSILYPERTDVPGISFS